jgi:divalent metal cation (Fe/Co/Zn/Cd) transporter
VVAVRLGTDSRDLLIGRAASQAELAAIADEITSTAGVDELVEVQTMHIGPDHLIVAARVGFADGISAGDVEDLAGQIDQRLAQRLPQMPHVFIDPTQLAPRAGPSA